MKRTTIWLALALSAVSTVAIFVTEFVYSSGFPAGAPWAVFFFLFAMALAAFTAIPMGIQRLSSNAFVGVGSILVGLFAAFAWWTLFMDQLPCFLGGSGC
jgi:hypothetical protein